jgi:hypothetical protein
MTLRRRSAILACPDTTRTDVVYSDRLQTTRFVFRTTRPHGGLINRYSLLPSTNPAGKRGRSDCCMENLLETTESHFAVTSNEQMFQRASPEFRPEVDKVDDTFAE